MYTQKEKCKVNKQEETPNYTTAPRTPVKQGFLKRERMNTNYIRQLKPSGGGARFKDTFITRTGLQGEVLGKRDLKIKYADSHNTKKRALLPETFRCSGGLTIEKVNSNVLYVEYKRLLKLWANEAMEEMNTETIESFREERKKIAAQEAKGCTPPAWGASEETACVCLDLLEQANEVGLAENRETQYFIKSENKPIGAITLSEGDDYPDAGGKAMYTVTGLVKKRNSGVQLGNCVPEFLSKVMNTSGNGKERIKVASAKGAINVYKNYGFESTETGAKHYDYQPCGCTVLSLK